MWNHPKKALTWITREESKTDLVIFDALNLALVTNERKKHILNLSQLHTHTHVCIISCFKFLFSEQSKMFVVVYFAIYCHTTEAAELYLLPHQELKKVAQTLPYVLLFSFHFTFDKTKGRKPLLPVEVTARAFFFVFYKSIWFSDICFYHEVWHWWHEVYPVKTYHGKTWNWAYPKKFRRSMVKLFTGMILNFFFFLDVAVIRLRVRAMWQKGALFYSTVVSLINLERPLLARNKLC